MQSSPNISHILPVKFLYVSSGGAFGQADGIELRGTIFHEFEGLPDAVQRTRRLQEEPSIEQWTEFRKFLDSYKVWDWKDSSEEKIVIDGGWWSFEIEYQDGKAINLFRYGYSSLEWSLLEAASAWLSNREAYYGDEWDWDEEGVSD